MRCVRGTHVHREANNSTRHLGGGGGGGSGCNHRVGLRGCALVLLHHDNDSDDCHNGQQRANKQPKAHLEPGEGLVVRHPHQLPRARLLADVVLALPAAPKRAPAMAQSLRWTARHGECVTKRPAIRQQLLTMLLTTMTISAYTHDKDTHLQLADAPVQRVSHLAQLLHGSDVLHKHPLLVDHQ